MNSLKLQRLVLAMAEHEGWHPVGDPKYPDGSRSYRNHNPGNLRGSPFADRKKDGYAVFGSDAMGWFAFQWDIWQKAQGNTQTKLSPKSTLRDLIYVWAPPSDNNNTEAYLADVVQKTGFSPALTLQEIIA